MRQRLQVQVVAVAIVAALFAAGASVNAQPLTITHFAGTNGGPSLSDDGTASAARFQRPRGVAVDGSGNVYVADTDNHTIRKVTPAGVVSTVAGLAGFYGSTDGTGSAARFASPFGVAVDGSGNVFVADSGNGTIRKITPSGAVSTLAGLAGFYGSSDGTGTAARFASPFGVAVDGSANVYVADTDNHTIRKVTPAGVVSTLAGSAGSFGSNDGIGSAARFESPWFVAVDASGNVYVSDICGLNCGAIRKVTPAGVVSTLVAALVNGVPSSNAIFQPTGVAVDGSGNVYVADERNGTIEKVTPEGVVTELVGIFSAGRFGVPYGVAVDSSGNVYVADSGRNTVSSVTPAGVATTLAGLAGAGDGGSADGTGPAARFNSPSGVAVDGSGNVYVADTDNHTIRKVTPTSVVSTIAGLAGSPGNVDGTGSAARFASPFGVAVDGSGNVFVADSGNSTIRKITPSGAVSTLAGMAGSTGSADGTGPTARFSGPKGVVVDGPGNVFVADSGNSTIRKITPSGVVSTLAGLAGFYGSSDGTRSAARFTFPSAVAVDGSGNVYVVDTDNHTIRRVTPAGVVSTIAGLAGSPGGVDGTGSTARFSNPSGVVVNGSGNVYVADTVNNCIRKGKVTAAPGFADAATIDAATGLVGQVRQLDTAPRTATSWQWSLIRRPSFSAAELSATNERNPTFTPDVPDLYVFRLTASDGSSTSITMVSLVATTAFVPGAAVTRLLPIVLDVSSGPAHYTTETALTNNTLSRLEVSMLYTASLGSKEGSGTVTDSLAPGEQKKIADVLSYLRDKGLAIPSLAEQPQQGGTLLVSFQGSGAIDPKLVSVTARTAALTATPQPLGRAGLAYSGLLATEASTSSVTIYGLRSTGTDRTNVAVFNTSSDPVTLNVTVCSGTGDGRCVTVRDAETLPAYGWIQYGSSQILDGNGITRGWATIERTSTTGSFNAYGVINDNTTNDGSFVLPVGSAIAGETLTVPVLVETPVFRSELILANKSAFPVTLSLGYVESINPPSGAGGSITVALAPKEEQIIPEALDYLRKNGVNIGAKDAAPYGGALRVTGSGTEADNVFAGARTASQSPAGGQFGLFSPCVYSGEEASNEAYLYGLRADSENRTNVAVVNAGDDSKGPILLQLQAYDGDAGGVAKGNPVSISLSPGQWAQPGNFFRDSGVANGWVKVVRMSGTAPWIAYGVINDGGNPGERTGDGAYVPMVK